MSMKKKVSWAFLKSVGTAAQTCYEETSKYYHLYSESPNGAYSFETSLKIGTPDADEFAAEPNGWKNTGAKKTN